MLTLEYLDPAALTPQEKNPWSHPPAQAGGLAAAIDSAGWAGAAVLNRTTGRLIDGHLRREEAIRRGEKLPTLVGEWSEAQERLLLRTINPLAMLAEQNAELLAALDAELAQDFDAGALVPDDRLKALLEEVTEPPAGPTLLTDPDALPEKAPPRCQNGDLWACGDHRIACGNVADPLTLQRLFGTQRAATLVTSPPYYGLRAYGTQPQVWGGDAACEHVFESTGEYAHVGNNSMVRGKDETEKPIGDWRKAEQDGHQRAVEAGATCRFCGAWRGELGLEPTPALWVEHMVGIFRTLRDVMREDATAWVNVGDSYAGGGGYSPDAPSNVAGSISAGGAGRGGMRTSGAIRTGTGLPPKNLLGMPFRLAFALQADGWILRSDIIWCLSGGARVYARTQKGDMPMMIKDLVRLKPETVQLWNGEKWTQVLGWSETLREETALEIELRTGERIGCTAGHRWPTERGMVRADELRRGDVIRTCRLPCEPRRTPYGLGWVGWFVGLYIAEGSRSDTTIQISCHADDKDRFERLAEFAARYHGTCRMHRTGGNSATINLYGPVLNGILDTYISGRTAHDKHLDPRCWERADEFLRDLLTGYLEGDGHFDAVSERWRLGFCANDNLAADLRTIAARLGLSLHLKRHVHGCNGGTFPGWKGDLRFDSEARRCPDGQVVAIRKSRARKFWSIGVEDEPHLFALASGVLTGNSKPNPMPESVTDRPTKAHEFVFLFALKERYFYDGDAVREEAARPGDVQTFGGQKGRGYQPEPDDPNFRNGSEQWGRTVSVASHRNRRTVWEITPRPYAEAHFATFPVALVEPCLLAGTSAKGECPQCGKAWVRVVERGQLVPDAIGYRPRGSDRPHPLVKRITAAGEERPTPNHHYETETLGWRAQCSCNADPVPSILFDPFLGAGTSMIAAEQHGRRAYGVELQPSYVDLCLARWEAATGKRAERIA